MSSPELPGRIELRSPGTPTLEMGAPVTSSLVVVPTPGPPGEVTAAQAQTMIDQSITTHVVAPEPHPAYDDLPSLTLIFENKLV